MTSDSVNRPPADKPGIEFVETGRKMSAASFCDRIYLENEDYTGRISYTGDYAGDLSAGKLDLHSFTTSVKPKKSALLLKVRLDTVVIQDPELESISPKFARGLAERLIKAGESAAALEKAIRSYMYPDGPAKPTENGPQG